MTANGVQDVAHPEGARIASQYITATTIPAITAWTIWFSGVNGVTPVTTNLTGKEKPNDQDRQDSGVYEAQPS